MTERQMQLEDWLDDLCVRFIINLPEDNLSSVERICFQVEEAQWFYEDFIRPLDPNLPSLSLRNFCLRIFTHCPLLSAFAVDGRHMQAFEEFLTYKKRIPVRGAIMLNEEMDAAVLVKGWKKGANWSFPRGKINKDEDDLICAIREVYEETGYDLEAAGLVPEDRQVKYIEVNMREQQMRLYVFKNVPMGTYFEPRTRKEISKIQWWRLSELPAFKKKSQHDQPDVATNANKFYMVAPFLVPLRKWVADQKKRDAKRTISNQYLSAGLSNDEFMTEEDRGEESAIQAPYHVSAPESNSLEEATEALSRLLKIRPPTQGLQLDATSAVQSPVTKSSGQALLALLQSKPSNPPPQTLLDHNSGKASVPNPSHQKHPRHHKTSTMPPPPNFPIFPLKDSFSYQEPNLETHRHIENIAAHHQSQQQSQTPRPHEDSHSYQSLHLIHPQPLPPHVQRAVFTGGPVHAPMVPQAISQYEAPQLNSIASVAVSNPQFPGLHAPLIPQVPKQTPPKLTSHSLALLNAFKSRDQASSEPIHPNDLPLRTYVQEPPHVQLSLPRLQELPAELSQPAPTTLQAPVPNPNIHSNTGPFVPRQPISATQRSTLLDMFKSPTAQAAVPTKVPTATALPTSSTPSAVELSAVEPLSSTAASTSALLNDKRTPDFKVERGTVPQLNPDANLPFRAMSILARPLEKRNKEGQVGPSTQKSHPRPSEIKSASVMNSKRNTTQPADKAFQPQILKRPQPARTKVMGPPTMPSPKLSSLTPQPTLERSAPPLLAQPTLERQTALPPGHKQTLLSLFGNPPLAANTLSRNPLTEVITSIHPANPSGRSRVGSLTSADAATRRGSQTPISPADKGFLLSYLDAVANGSQR